MSGECKIPGVQVKLECLLCMKDYTDPKTLSCFDTFCLKCLQDHCSKSAEGSARCPKCNETIKIPDKGLESLKCHGDVRTKLIEQEKKRKKSHQRDTTGSASFVAATTPEANDFEERLGADKSAELSDIVELDYSSYTTITPTIRRAALGRHATVGDLYDATTDSFIIGTSLLRPEMKNKIKITPVETRKWKVTAVDPDNVEERMTRLDMCREMQLSVLAGLVQPRGHAEYLANRAWSTIDNNKIHGALVCTMITAERGIDVTSARSLGQWLSVRSDAEVEPATHVVVGIECGIRIVISLAADVREGESIDIQRDEFNKSLRQFEECMNNLNDIANSNESFSTLLSELSNCEITIYTDNNVDATSLKTLPDVIPFMRKEVGVQQSSNDLMLSGLQYILYPLSSVVKTFSINLSIGQYENNLSDDATGRSVVDNIIRLLDTSEGFIKNIKTFQNIIRNYTDHISDHINEEIKLILNTTNDVQDWQERIKGCLKSIRTGKQDFTTIFKLEDEANSRKWIDKLRQFRIKAVKTAEHISFIRRLQNHGVICLTNRQSVADVRSQCNLSEYYIFFYKFSEASSSLQKNRDLFLHLCESEVSLKTNSTVAENDSRRRVSGIAVDIELCPNQQENEQLPEGIRICYYSAGVYVLLDVLEEVHNFSFLNIAKSTVPLKKMETRPLKYAYVELPCPNFIDGACPKTSQRWVCDICNEILEYDINLKTIYCSCGSAPYQDFTYKCHLVQHGHKFTRYETTALEDIISNLVPIKCTNILVLGETGVGKSTWINGIVNYATFKSLDEASEFDQVYLIPSFFSITNEETYETTNIAVGECKDEHLATEGQSSTQEPKAYRFVYGDQHIRLIDTPGIGDTRSIEQDIENFDKIMKYLSHIDILHGICILLKPNNSKLTPYFKFCLKQLFTHLHKDAAHNIAFCFTNSRGTGYTPGDTLTPLRTLLSTSSINIEISKSNMYCFDNESFRYLCMIHSKVTPSTAHNMLTSYRESWKVSVSETTRLLENVSNRAPHDLINTVSLNAARNIISRLTEPLANISLNIEKNIKAIERQLEKIRCCDDTNEDWKSKLMIKVTHLVAQDVDCPYMVCNSSKCCTKATSPGTDVEQVIYKTRCHSPCNLSGVETKKYPNPMLLKCNMINKDLKCDNCGCDWTYHMHITYEYKEEEKEIIDSTVQDQIRNGENRREVMMSQLKSATQTKEEYQKEQEIITNSCAKFGAFLKSKSMIAYNDAFEQYIQFLIKSERDLAAINEDRTRIDNLESMSRRYQEQIRLIDAAGIDENQGLIEDRQVHELKDKLMQLPHSGSQLKQILDVVTSAEIQHKRHEIFYNPKFVLERSGKNAEYDKRVSILKALKGKLGGKLFKICKSETSSNTENQE